MRIRSLKTISFFTSLFLLIALPLPAAEPVTELVSISSEGTQGNSYSYRGSISGDCRYVAFESDANNLVPGDTNNDQDIFIRDRKTGTTTRVNINSSGSQGNNHSFGAIISFTGRYVTFTSRATNLVQGTTNGFDGVFVHDRQTKKTSMASISSSGSEGNNHSYASAISSDGRYVCFASYASNLVENDTNGVADIFVHDRQTGETIRVDVDSAGAQANKGGASPSVSADGRYIAFESSSSNLVADDTNTKSDIFVHDQLTGATTRISVDSMGNQADGNSDYPVIASEGGYVVFRSYAANLVPNDTNGLSDTFLHNLETGTTVRVSEGSKGEQAEGPYGSDYNYLSGDGRFILFTSAALNLVDNHQGWFLKDLATGALSNIDFSPSGISADGNFLVFYSGSSLVPEDTNNTTDVYVRGPLLTPPPRPKFIPAIPMLLLLSKPLP
ncbi:MAG: hypothetical protein ACYC9M_12820 [Desulfobulbaceae bacterium]